MANGKIYCGIEITRKKGVYINKIWRCKNCHKKKKAAHREFLKREVCGIRKRSPNGTRKGVPIIKGVKEKRIIPPMGFTFEERQFLFKKYIKSGLSKDEINIKIQKDIDYIKELVNKLRTQQTPEENLNKKFKEEFAKLVGGL